MGRDCIITNHMPSGAIKSSKGSKGSKVVEVSAVGAGHHEDVLAALRFTPPRQTNSTDGGEACLARAYVMPGRSALRVAFPSCRIVKVRGQTVHARAPREALDLLMSLDERVIEVAKNSVDAWFLHRMDPDLVEEYYRGNSATDIRHGIVARFVVEGTCKLEVGAAVDLTMQFHGVQFRRQYFTATWKLVSSVPAVDPQHAVTTDRFVFRGSDDGGASDQEGDDPDAEDEDEDGPNAEECAEMRQALMARLLDAENVHMDALDRVREMVHALEASPITDIRTLEEVERLLGVFFSRE
jgi:hypothetical protein